MNEDHQLKNSLNGCMQGAEGTPDGARAVPVFEREKEKLCVCVRERQGQIE